MLFNKKILVILFCFWMNFSFSQVQVFSLNQIDSLMKINPKPILILLSTDWCSYCKVQKQLVQKSMLFKTKSTNFYYVEFDAESSETIIFKNQVFSNHSKKNRKQTHAVVLDLLGSKQPVYPTWLLLDTDYKIKFKHQGFLKPKFLDELITVIHNN